MNKKVLISAAALGLVFSFQTCAGASTLENESLGIKMEIDDQDQLTIITQDLPAEIDDSLSVCILAEGDSDIAYLVTMTDATDEAGFYDYIFDDFEEYGYTVYGDKVNQNGFTYYLVCMDPEENALAESIQAAFDQAEFSTPVAPDLSKVDFKAYTLDGEEVDNEFFAAKDFTMINVWSTTCNPCLMELPEMAEWEEELPDNVQILYLDLESAGIEAADKGMISAIIEKTGLNPEQVLLYERGLCSTIDSLVTATPTTFFVDSNGNTVGEVILGADLDGYKEGMNELLESK